MFDVDLWGSIEEALLCDNDFDFMYDFVAGELERLVWIQNDLPVQSFLIKLRFENDRLVLSWGWKDVTLHEAVVWGSEPLDSQECQPSSPKYVHVPNEQLIDSVKQEIRRVAEFGLYELKRELEFAELKAAFDRVIEGWREYLKRADMHLLHSSELPAEGWPQLETPNPEECTLTHGKKAIKLSKDESGWRIDVDETYESELDMWRFVEETITRQRKEYYIHSSDLLDNLFRALVGI